MAHIPGVTEKCAKLYAGGFIAEANILMLEALAAGNVSSKDTSVLFQNIRTDYRIVNESIEVLCVLNVFFMRL